MNFPVIKEKAEWLQGGKIMTNNTIRFASENTAVASKVFMRNAMIYGSNEYKILKTFKAENPNVTVSAKKIKKNPYKDSCKNLTYNNMIAYINELPNNAELLTEFEKTKRMSAIAKNKYRYVVNWFKSTCFDNEQEFTDFRRSIATVEVPSATGTFVA